MPDEGECVIIAVACPNNAISRKEVAMQKHVISIEYCVQ